jgi:adenylate kinase family enzyme
VLTAADPLLFTPRRILVAGTPGSGKTTLAGRIGTTVGAPHTEIDALYHGPNWTRRDSFLVDVAALAAQPRWVTEWHYHEARPILLRGADLLVWLDLPRAVVMRRVLRRTVQRRRTRTVLWNGNRELPLSTFFTDRDHIVRWAWRTHHENAKRVAAAMASREDLNVVRLASQQDVDRWLVGTLLEAIHPNSHPG